MKHSSRRILALLLALSLCIGMMPMSIFADEPETTGDSVAAETVLDLADEKTDEPAAEDKKVDEVVTEPAAEDKKVDEVVTEPAAEDKKVDEVVTEPAAEDKKADEVVTEPTAEDKKVDEVVTEPVEEKKADEVVTEPAAGDKKVDEAAVEPIEEEQLAEAESSNEEEEDLVVENVAKTLMKARSGGICEVHFYFGYRPEGMQQSFISRSVSCGSPIIAPAIPEGNPHPDWELVGWEFAGNLVDLNTFSSHAELGPYPLYAVWAKPGEEWYTVTYESGFADCSAPSPMRVKKGDSPSIIYNYHPEHEGFQYTDEWFLKDDLLNAKSDFNYETDWALTKDIKSEYRIFSIPVYKDTTYVLRWDKVWNVTFNVNTGEESKARTVSVTDGKLVEKPEDPTWLDHRFLGWFVNTSEDGQEPNYVEYDFKTPVTSDLALYAQWEEACVVKYYPRYPMFFFVDKDAKDVYEVTYGGSSEEFENKKFAAAQYSETGFQSEDTFPGWRFVGWEELDEDPNTFHPIFPPGGGEVKKSVDLRHTDLKVRKANNDNLAKDLVKQDGEPSESNTPTNGNELYKPNDPVDLHTTVYMGAVWEPYPAVIYLPQYPFDVEDKVTDPNSFYAVEGDDLGEDLTKYAVLSFSETGLEAAPGYEFVGWRMQQVPYEQQAVSGEVGGETPAVQKAEESVRMVEAKKAVRRVTEESSRLQEAEQEIQPAELKRLYDKPDTVDISEYHFTFFYAEWNRRPTVTYHTAYEDLDPAPKMEEKEYMDPTQYSWPKSEEDEANFKFKVLPVSATGFKAPEGYVFSHWRLTWTERELQPEIVVDYPIGEIEEREERYRDDVKKIRLAETARSAEERIPAESAEAVDIIPVADKAELTGKDPGPFYGGEIYPLHLRVDLYAVWVPAKFVQYNTNYPTDTPNFVADDWIDKTAETYTVKNLEEVKELNEEFVAPAGYVFAGWVKDEKTPSENNPKLDPGAKVDLPNSAIVNGNGDDNTSGKEPVVTDKVTGTSEATKVKVLVTETMEEKLDVLNEKDKIEQQEDEEPTAAQKVPDPEIIFYAQWVKGYTAIWVDEDGDSPIDGFDPITFTDPENPPADNYYKETLGDPAPKEDGREFVEWIKIIERDEEGNPTGNIIYQAVYESEDPGTDDPTDKIYTATWVDDQDNPIDGYGPDEFNDPENPPAEDKYGDAPAKQGYTFKEWTRIDEKDDQTGEFTGNIIYKAVYDPVPGRPTTRPTNDTPAEDVSEIENNETPLAPATVDPVEDVDDEEVADAESPLAGFEVEPEEDDEIAEEATPLSPFTGDSRHTVVWGIVSILSLLGIVLVARKRKEE